jgi:DNA polymerase III subunit epsilon
VLLSAIKESDIDVASWITRVEQPLFGSSIAQEGNPNEPLHGEVLVFTGALRMARSEAAGLAAKFGCTVEEGVTKHTTILIVGDQDSRKMAVGYDKSAKHRKAEDLICKGLDIKIITERSFEQLTLPAQSQRSK